ncbi:2-polyprenyl-6-methoxyphenol hydroxylase [Geodermatophilus telluris]|uniref:2-polyprenyl-6-methoxyphenol hydroxylase n=1 Tax=Geodermatophilus telluris TaxID=1190417 RepID=A0A1G6QMA7_9ACTN|nr:FAD-dependent oxidoreductase [Geodermatophilus telluris]SDC93459.1 2-polyprenyl-6-methoxyphenol hydroxylase [Geodermatophilus telluris]
MTSTQDLPATTTVCIAGCGPAGAVLGLLLGRAGIDVVVLEKHADFLRDFRGDTVHASTMQVLAELDLLEGFEELPQQRTTSISLMTDDGFLTLGDFTRLPGRFQCLSMVPQYELLDFLTTEAARSSSFTLHRQVEVVGLVEEDGTVTGVRYRRTDGSEGKLCALLTVAADGRSSAVRRAAGMSPVEFGAPMDVLWYRLPKGPGDPPASFARLVPGRLLPMIDRGSYWQGAYTMPKGTVASLRAEGIEALRADLARAMPFLADRLDGALRSWEDTGFLEVRVNRLRRWYRPGLLCIGDAAHAMSPVAGVGINLAVQDAVAAANALVRPLRRGAVTPQDLRRVQRRRDLPTRVTQLVQRGVQRQMFGAAGGTVPPRGVPVALRLMSRVPPMLRLFSRFMAIGIRNEHVALPAQAVPAAAGNPR